MSKLERRVTSDPSRSIGAMMDRSRTAGRLAACLGLLALPALVQPRSASDPDRVAARIVGALTPARGEVVVLRVDEHRQAGLAGAARAALARAGADVRTVAASTPIARAADGHRGARAFVTLAADPDIADAERLELPAWLHAQDARHLNLDWRDGTRAADGLLAEDADHAVLYTAALDEQPPEIGARLAKAEALLRSGDVRIRTPLGTSLRFSLGDRPVVREDGDASAARTARAPVPAGRNVHLPAGALRLAPLESTVSGRLELPEARFDTLRATTLRLFFVRGRALELQCCTDREPPLDAEAAAPLGAFATRYFEGVPLGEITLGFNTRLARRHGDGAIPFHGFGAGMVRLCVGDNEALGGLVRGVDGGPIRCFYLPGATVEAGGTVLVRDGTLMGDLRRGGA